MRPWDVQTVWSTNYYDHSMERGYSHDGVLNFALWPPSEGNQYWFNPCVEFGSVGPIFNVYSKKNDTMNNFLTWDSLAFTNFLWRTCKRTHFHWVHTVHPPTYNMWCSGPLELCVIEVWKSVCIGENKKKVTKRFAVCLQSVFLHPGPTVST